MRYLYVLLALGALCVTTLAEPMAVSLSYDATLGGATADNPTNQGFTASEILLGAGGNAWPTNESGTLAWVIDDSNTNAAYDLPQYFQDSNKGIGRVRMRLMYDYGWVHEFTVKAVGKSHFLSWGCAANGNPWTNAIFRAGLNVGLTGDAFHVDPEGGGPKSTLGAGSGSDYHTVRAEGHPGTNAVDLYIDGAYQQTYDFSIGGGSTADPNRISTQSGSSLDTGRIMHYHKMSLTPVLPESVLFASEFQQMDFATGSAYQHGSLQTNTALVGAWSGITGTPRVRHGKASSPSSDYARDYEIGAGSKYMRIGSAQNCTGSFSAPSLRDGLVVTFDLQRWGSSTGPTTRGPLFALKDRKGADVLNLKLNSNNAAAGPTDVHYNVSDHDDWNSGTAMPASGGGTVTSRSVVWTHYTVTLDPSSWTLKVEEWIDGGQEATTLTNSVVSTDLSYMSSIPAVEALYIHQSPDGLAFWSNVLAIGTPKPEATVFVVR